MVCTFCSKQTPHLVSICSENESSALADLIYENTGMKPCKDVAGEHMICYECLETFNVFELLEVDNLIEYVGDSEEASDDSNSFQMETSNENLKDYEEITTCDSRAEDTIKLQALTCVQCQWMCSTFSDLLIHFQYMHNTIGYAECCDQRFFQRRLFYDHINVHRDPMFFHCDKCDQNFPNRVSLRQHFVRHHKTGQTNVVHICIGCSSVFDKKSKLKAHAKTHAPAVEFSCEFCHKSFAMQSQLDDHIECAHSELIMKICHFCGVNVSGRHEYVQHMQSVHAGNYAGKPIELQQRSRNMLYLCPSCRLTFTNEKEFNRHISEHDVAQYPCNVCGLVFQYEENLLKHQKLFCSPSSAKLNNIHKN